MQKYDWTSHPFGVQGRSPSQVGISKHHKRQVLGYTLLWYSPWCRCPPCASDEGLWSACLLQQKMTEIAQPMVWLTTAIIQLRTFIAMVSISKQTSLCWEVHLAIFGVVDRYIAGARHLHARSTIRLGVPIQGQPRKCKKAPASHLLSWISTHNLNGKPSTVHRNDRVWCRRVIVFLTSHYLLTSSSNVKRLTGTLWSSQNLLCC